MHQTLPPVFYSFPCSLTVTLWTLRAAMLSLLRPSQQWMVCNCEHSFLLIYSIIRESETDTKWNVNYIPDIIFRKTVFCIYLSKCFVSRKIRIYELLCRIKIIYSGMISWECSGMVTLFLLKRRKLKLKNVFNWVSP